MGMWGFVAEMLMAATMAPLPFRTEAAAQPIPGSFSFRSSVTSFSAKPCIRFRCLFLTSRAGGDLSHPCQRHPPSGRAHQAAESYRSRFGSAASGTRRVSAESLRAGNPFAMRIHRGVNEIGGECVELRRGPDMGSKRS